MTFNITPVFFNIGINEQVPSQTFPFFEQIYKKNNAGNPGRPTGLEWAPGEEQFRQHQDTCRLRSKVPQRNKKIPKEVKENPAEHFYERYRKGGFFERAAERVGRNGRQMVGTVHVNDMF